MANPNDDDDEPPLTRRVAEDERDDYVPPPPKPVAVTGGSDSAEMRRLMLEEMKFHLEERKELHKMEIEIRKVEQDERDKAREQRRQDRELAAKEEKGNEHWLKSFWRPAMGWLYMGICFMDFIGFPLLTIFLPIIFKPFGLTMPYTAWKSLTLDNGGLIHIAFGAILGVAAFSRGQDKATGKNNLTN